MAAGNSNRPPRRTIRSARDIAYAILLNHWPDKTALLPLEIAGLNKTTINAVWKQLTAIKREFRALTKR